MLIVDIKFEQKHLAGSQKRSDVKGKQCHCDWGPFQVSLASFIFSTTWNFTCWWDFVCCCWSVKVKIKHVAKVKVLMSGVFDNVEQSSESSCAMSKRGTLLPRCYLLLQFPLCQSLSCAVLQSLLQSSKMKFLLQVHLQYDKLYVDGKCFVWNDHRGKVTNPESFVWYPFGKHTYFAMVTTIMIIPT